MTASPVLPEKPTDRHETEAALRAIFRWSYEPEIEELRDLYANALERQWIAMRDLDWERGVDRDAFSRTFTLMGLPIQETRFWQSLPEETRWEVSRRTSAFLLSNFLHGEQGALLVASQLVSAVPHMDGKFYAATQTMDEARHVEVFDAYVRKLDAVQPISAALQQLLDRVLGHPDWMHKAVGMQIVIEGLALYSFRDMRNATEEPLLKQLLTYVSRDEARHTAYGIRYLTQALPAISPAERAELEDFAFEATRLLIDSRQDASLRTDALRIWAECGIDPKTLFAELFAEREMLMAEMARRGGAFGPVRGFVIPTLKGIGLWSQRLEARYRELFDSADRLGVLRGARVGFDVVLPKDLERWVLGEEA
ncbi:MAG TPA: ferritin-like domain-containing protein [Myxococcota bacterium]|jgi:hypothetical protein|nr:ferritin-like domain-containing protein [Myxococcota bacterium]